MQTTQPMFLIEKDHPCLEGHFPSNPIVPGVVILDEVTNIILQQNSGFKICGFSYVKFLQPLLAEQEVIVKLGDKTITNARYLKIKFSLYYSHALIVQGAAKLEDCADYSE